LYSVDKGLKVNSMNYQKRTALHLAVIGRNEEVVRALLKVGASVNIQVSSTFKEYIV
jgi:ankyrin repeat protein